MSADLLIGIITAVTILFLIYTVIKDLHFVYVIYAVFLSSLSLFLIRSFLMGLSPGRAFLKSFDPIFLFFVAMIAYSLYKNKKE
ncbi:hypothetical protein [Macrococcus brunensis]|uniref:hypothetical protein n=1 Tax=Macrococcus brunensis TaxID=198483 RepID=UPI001EEFA4F9|nr:hypothetical protein [Macrococcus brunensis]ULG70990.1 hypothetical protein MGG12_06410 [Macrococcus brunensis]ULG73327.1 hypothetical protein MGG13_06270 [Macrococcus brunensis]